MFDTMKIAGVIKQARIDRNMTQMQLADAMGVSYQAVSNWERGNSMPDISKLEDLCRALDITVEQLLGMETRTAEAVNKVIHEEDLTVEELKEVAPVLPPEEVRERVEANREWFMPDLSFLGEISDKLKEKFGNVHSIHIENSGEKSKRKKVRDLSDLADLAAFLDEAYLGDLVLEAAEISLDGIDDLAPFLSEETLEKVVEIARPEDLEELADIACHLSEKALDLLARRLEAAGEWELIADTACFLSEQTLDALVDRLIAGEFDPEEMDDISDLYPFLSQASLKKLAKYLIDRRDLEALEDLIPFV